MDDWVQHALRDYYKPKLRRDLQRDPSPDELDQRFREVYNNLRFTLLAGVREGVGIQFYQIAQFTLAEFAGFRDDVEGFLAATFGGGWFKLNFYDGGTFAVTLNYKPKGEPKWQHLLPQKN